MQMRLFLMESPFLVSLAIADGPWQWIETFENGLDKRNVNPFAPVGETGIGFCFN
jgi:hypothetical protein